MHLQFSFTFITPAWHRDSQAHYTHCSFTQRKELVLVYIQHFSIFYSDRRAISIQWTCAIRQANGSLSSANSSKVEQHRGAGEGERKCFVSQVTASPLCSKPRWIANTFSQLIPEGSNAHSPTGHTLKVHMKETLGFVLYTQTHKLLKAHGKQPFAFARCPDNQPLIKGL